MYRHNSPLYDLIEETEAEEPGTVSSFDYLQNSEEKSSCHLLSDDENKMAAGVAKSASPYSSFPYSSSFSTKDDSKNDTSSGLTLDDLTISSQHARYQSGQMHHLLGRFKYLYEDKLQKLDELELSGQNTTKSRMKILRSYIDDVNEQNKVLVLTIEELESESSQRVEILETKLNATSKCIKRAYNLYSFIEVY
ncbi:hypothetical protein LOTGIDRAFT_167087 [Lottia gigantea]|uniref:Uncharacterized protein n=1 Tax=Lottia gigantea TaxID=225164 RepID=V4BDG6_LOTGI|nr:hypothetical protein LOTGIDRAFT_167087 [Lottia gigantea]ESO86564.1 hypothetical protein LOTGIDRAFT_167087 [Lottia gigantea]